MLSGSQGLLWLQKLCVSLEKTGHTHEEAALSVLDRTVEWPELERTHKDQQRPAPHLAQDNPGNHTQNTQMPKLTWGGPEIQTTVRGEMDSILILFLPFPNICAWVLLQTGGQTICALFFSSPLWLSEDATRGVLPLNWNIKSNSWCCTDMPAIPPYA